MKKFFSFVCAIAIALCASAAPIAPKAQLAKNAPVAVEQMQKVQIEKAQPAMKAALENAQPMNFNQLSATPALKVTNQKAQAPATKPAAKEIFVNVANADLNTRTLAAGFWTIGGTTADKNNSVNIYFISKGLQGTFTDVEQFDAYSTWVSDKSTGTNVYYENLSAVNLTSAIDGDSLKITGTLNLSDSQGNPAIVTVHITTPFTQTWGDWADFAPFGVNTGKYTLNAMFNRPRILANIPVKVRKDNTGLRQYQFLNLGVAYYGPNGTTMTINMTADNICTIQPMAVTVPTSSGSMDIILTDAYTYTQAADDAKASYYEPEEGIFNLSVVVLDAQGQLYKKATNETMVMDKPITERDTVDVVSNKMTYVDYLASDQAVQYFAGSDATGYTQFIVTSLNASTIDGTFDLYQGYCFADSTDNSQITFAEGQFSVVNEDGVYHLTGWLIGSNDKYYRLDWTERAGVLDYDTDAPFDATFAYGDMSASIEDGVISISATNAGNQAISLELYTNPANTTIPEGTYVISDAYEAGTALQSVGLDGGYLQKCYAGILAASGSVKDCFFMVEGTITLSYDEYGKLKVVVDAENSWGQPVTATIAYEKLEPKATVEINNADFFAYNGYLEEYGLMNFYGANADGYEFDLYAYADTCAGDFVDVIDFGDCEIKSVTDGYSVGIRDAFAFNVVADGKNLTLTAQLLGKDTIQYNITATGYVGALEYDAKEAYNGEFAMEEVTLSQAETLVSIIGLNAAGDSINLVVEGELVGGVLPAGEYTNIMASPGFYAYNFTPSFVLNEDAAWFFQSGKLTVAANGSMTFEGLNSYDKAVTVTIGEQGHGTNLPVINATRNATKVFRNGRLMIIKDNKHFNALGAEVK